MSKEAIFLWNAEGEKRGEERRGEEARRRGGEEERRRGGEEARRRGGEEEKRRKVKRCVGRLQARLKRCVGRWQAAVNACRTRCALAYWETITNGAAEALPDWRRR